MSLRSTFSLHEEEEDAVRPHAGANSFPLKNTFVPRICFSSENVFVHFLKDKTKLQGTSQQVKGAGSQSKTFEYG